MTNMILECGEWSDVIFEPSLKPYNLTELLEVPSARLSHRCLLEELNADFLWNDDDCLFAKYLLQNIPLFKRK
jgi:hypothetical protein